MPPRGRKRKSEQSIASEADHAPSTMTAATPKRTWITIATKPDSAEESSLRKRQRTGMTLAQKQALIDNLQLEVTERARKLRAQYHLQAQGLRTRIEIRVNRIPTALRKATMGELFLKRAADQPKPATTLRKMAHSSEAAALAPPVPEKDYVHGSSRLARGTSPARTTVGRPPMYLGDNFASGDKENQGAHLEYPKMRPRANYAGATTAAGSGQVLSPASPNARMNPGDREWAAAVAPSPAKSLIARPMSPTKQQAQAATNLLSAMVEKARSTRPGTARKPTASSAAAAGSQGRSQASRAPSRAAGGRAPSRMAKRTSGISESSEASTATVVRKVGRPPGRAGAAARTTASAARKAAGTATASTTAAPAPKKATVMSSIKKGIAGAATKRTANAAANTTSKASTMSATSATTRSGRVLRKRD